MFWGEFLVQVVEIIFVVCEQVCLNGCEVEFSLLFWFIFGCMEDEVWVKVEVICVSVGVCLGEVGFFKGKLQSVGVQCLFKVVEQGECFDECFWIGIVRLVGGGYNFIVLVGIVEQVVDVLFVYYDLGVCNIFICGFDFFVDVVEYGCELILLICVKVVECECWCVMV